VRIGIDASALRVQFGGIQRYTDQLLRGLERVDRENRYVLYRAPDEEWSYALPARFERDRRQLPLKRWIDSVFLADPVHKLDLFHGTNYWAPLLHRYPSVLTVHDLTVRLFPRNHPPARRIAHRLLPALCRGARRIIADSHNTKRDLERCYGVAPERVDVVHLAAGDEFRPIEDGLRLEAVRRRHDLPERFALFVGSLEPRKNLSLLVRALAELRTEFPDLRLVIAGDGSPEYKTTLCAHIARAGMSVGREVVITGHIPDEDLPALYNLSEFFVYPSVYEGFGLPPLEAMACGRPAIVPDNSCFAELYQGCAVLCPLVSTAHLVRAMRLLLRSETLRSELVECGLKLATARSWDDTARETMDVYRRAAAEAA